MIVTIVVLILSAVLEAGGDALIRVGLTGRIVMFIAGGACLVAYGVLVNQGKVDFGRLIGAYIGVLFIVSQAIAIIYFHQYPRPKTIVGGAAIVAGAIAILV